MDQERDTQGILVHDEEEEIDLTIPTEVPLTLEDEQLER